MAQLLIIGIVGFLIGYINERFLSPYFDDVIGRKQAKRLRSSQEIIEIGKRPERAADSVLNPRDYF